MKKLLEKAGLSFLRAFGASLLVLLTGVLSAPNLDQSYALGVAALIASVTAGLRAVQVFVPKLTFENFFTQPWASWSDSFSRAFLGAFIVGVIGIMNAPDLATARALGVAAIIGAVAAGLRALQGLSTSGETPLANKGL